MFRSLAFALLLVGAIFSQQQVTHADTFNTISGTFTNRAGDPIPNARLAFGSQTYGSQNILISNTDANGHYSINVAPDNYKLYGTDFHYSGMGSFATSNTIDPGYPIDVSSGNVTQDLALDVVGLTVNFVDQNNQPIPNAQVFVTPIDNSGTTTLLSGRTVQYGFNSAEYSTVTDVNGAVTPTVIRNTSYVICVIYPTTSTRVCSTHIFNGNANSITISQGLPPSAPTNLSAASPTKAPHLTWDAVTNATSYNIYRNGTVIGTSTTNSYTDNSASSGNNTYNVSAVRYSSGESGSSNTINVIVDNTAPVVTNVYQVWNVAKQRTEITLTFNEPVSGLPQGWYGNGTSYTKAFYNTKLATVTFVDVVGNPGIATVTPIGAS